VNENPVVIETVVGIASDVTATIDEQHLLVATARQAFCDDASRETSPHD
jgi:hypothetical protein